MRASKGFWIVVSYALILAFFGFIGYKAGGSVVSLLAGSFSAVLLLVASVGLLYQKKWGSYLLWISLSAITLLFFFRGYMTHKPVPIFLSVLSAAVFVTLLLRNPSSKS